MSLYRVLILKNVMEKKIINFSNENLQLDHNTHGFIHLTYLFDRNINSEKKLNRIHDVDVADRMKKVGLNFGYLNEITYIAQPRPGENQIGIRAMRENKDY